MLQSCTALHSVMLRCTAVARGGSPLPGAAGRLLSCTAVLRGGCTTGVADALLVSAAFGAGARTAVVRDGVQCCRAALLLCAADTLLVGAALRAAARTALCARSSGLSACLATAAASTAPLSTLACSATTEVLATVTCAPASQRARHLRRRLLL